MLRPCFLVVDREHSSSISTRKLVIETAKMNVITAYSAEEAVQTLRKFPKVDGVVMDAYLRDATCDDVCRQMREACPGILIVAISGPGRHPCSSANHVLETFEPAKLLQLLKNLDPATCKAIEAREEQLFEIEVTTENLDAPKS